MMADDEALVADIDKGLIKNQNMLKQTMTKIDSVITSASNNVLCYTLLFFIMVLGLLYKLTKWILFIKLIKSKGIELRVVIDLALQILYLPLKLLTLASFDVEQLLWDVAEDQVFVKVQMLIEGLTFVHFTPEGVNQVV